MGRWDSYYRTVAEAVAQNSVCLSRQIGAILVKDKSIISTGYNGPPRGFYHCNDLEMLDWYRLGKEHVGCCPRRARGYKSGEGLHLCPAGHAERNTLINAARNGISTMGTTMYTTFCLPCKDCAIEIINAGVKEIVIVDTENVYDRLSPFLFRNSEVIVRGYSK